jgi:polar amino acid transport system substrate-binding protein
MKKSKILKLTLSLLVMGSVLVGCVSKTSKNDEYIIATDAKYAPFSMEVNGKYEGIDVEILEAVAKESGFEYKLEPMDFNAIIAALGSNQIDGAIAGMSITEERKKTYDFSDGYFESGLSIVVKGDNTEIKGKEDLVGKSVAVKNGTAGEKWAQDHEKELNLTITHYEDSPTMYLAVQNGNNDFALEDYPVVAYKIKVDNDGKLKIAGDKLTTADYGFAVNKGQNAELLEKFQAGLKAIKENGKYDEIISKYITE